MIHCYRCFNKILDNEPYHTITFNDDDAILCCHCYRKYRRLVRRFFAS